VREELPSKSYLSWAPIMLDDEVDVDGWTENALYVYDMGRREQDKMSGDRME
jgi:hypothetical protein